jgi:glutathione-regulated potassium-efflux system ancillary protein KefC
LLFLGLAGLGLWNPALLGGWKVALVAALGLALSSTAIALQVMGERNLLPTQGGQAGFSILLFQDVAAIPILALLPLLGGAPRPDDDTSLWIDLIHTVGVIAAIVLGGRLLLRPVLRWIANSRTPEIFTAASLLLVVGIAGLMQLVGLSMGLGAFLAGVLLAESEYRRELETDIEPFKGLLLGLFFIAVGMNVDLGVLRDAPGLMALLVLGFMAIKTVLILLITRVMGVPAQERPVLTLLLAQGGEFAFVVFQAAAGAQVMTPQTASLLVGAVAVSMLLSPLLLVALDRWIMPRLCLGDTIKPDEISEPQEAPVLIAGFGRYGQIISRVMMARGWTCTVLDHDADMIDVARNFGYRVHYGDATRLDLLRIAGVATAKVLVVAVDDKEQSLRIVDLVREHFPELPIVARAKDVTHWHELRERGVTLVQRELFESSLRSAHSVLELMGDSRADASAMIHRFRQHNLDLFERMRPHFRDRNQLIAVAKQGRQQLEEQMALERTQRQGDAQASAKDTHTQ